MPPIMIPGFFLCMGLWSLVSLVGSLQTGVVLYQRGDIDVKESPGLFYVRICIQVAFIAFSTAVVLHAFGLVGDPFIWAHHYLPFLMPR